jgi:hypothetical protein
MIAVKSRDIARTTIPRECAELMIVLQKMRQGLARRENSSSSSSAFCALIDHREVRAMRAMSRQAQCKQANAVVLLLWIALACGCHRSRTAEADGGASAQGSSLGDIGVAECDDYLAKYKQCIDTKVPADRKNALENGLARTRTTWKMLADNPGARPGLTQACHLALETAQTTMKRYACGW